MNQSKLSGASFDRAHKELAEVKKAKENLDEEIIELESKNSHTLNKQLENQELARKNKLDWLEDDFEIERLN